jgi:hypothetical protein
MFKIFGSWPSWDSWGRVTKQYIPFNNVEGAIE